MGGLSWNYSVYSVLFAGEIATACAIAASYLRSQAEAIYVRAEDLGKHKVGPNFRSTLCFQGHPAENSRKFAIAFIKDFVAGDGKLA